MEDKLKSTMGWDISAITNTFMKGSGKLRFDECEFFWKQLEGSEKKYFEVLIQYLKGFENAIKISGSVYDSSPDQKYTANDIINTMGFLVFFDRLDYLSIEIKKQLNNIKEAKLDISIRAADLFNDLKNYFDEDTLKSVLNMVFKPEITDSSESALIKTFNETDYGIFDNNLVIKSSKQKLFGGIKFFQLISLYRLLENEENRERAIVLICDALESSLYVSIDERRNEYNKVTSGILILNYIYDTYYGEAVDEEFDDVISTVYNFCYWPKPICIKAYNLIQKIKSDRKFNGSSLLLRFSKHSFIPSIKIPIPFFENYRCINWVERKTKPLFYIANLKIIQARLAIKEMKVFEMDLEKFNQIKLFNGISSKTFHLIIIYIFKINKILMLEDLTNLEWLTKKQLKKIFNEIVQINNNAISGKEKENVKDKMMSLRKRIFDTAMENINKPSENLVPIKKMGKYPKNFKPDFPPYGHIVINPKNLTNEDSYLDHVESIFTAIFAKYGNLELEESSVVIKIVLFDEPKLIAKILKILYDKRNSDVNFEFYIIPSTDQTIISKFIAKFDTFYNVYVYIPMVYTPILPLFDYNENDHESESKIINNEISPKGQFFRKIIENYVETADKIIDIAMLLSKIYYLKEGQLSCINHVSISKGVITFVKGRLTASTELKLDVVTTEKEKKIELQSMLIETIRFEKISEKVETANKTPFDESFTVIVDMGDKSFPYVVKNLQVEDETGMKFTTEDFDVENVHKIQISTVQNANRNISKGGKNLSFRCRSFVNLSDIEIK